MNKMTFNNILEILQQLNKETCIEKACTGKENGRKITITSAKNKLDIYRITLDKCFLKTHNTKSCDFLFFALPKIRYVFVELKGTEIDKACKQFESAFAECQNHFELNKGNTEFLLVSSSVPKAASQKFRIKSEQLRRLTGITLKKVHRFHHTHVLA